ncbi:hypothetical protein FBU59_002402, partial [Linderina macrospora]
ARKPPSQSRTPSPRRPVAKSGGDDGDDDRRSQSAESRNNSEANATAVDGASADHPMDAADAGATGIADAEMSEHLDFGLGDGTGEAAQ